MRGGAGMGQEKSMRGGGEDLILRPHPAPLPSLGEGSHCQPKSKATSIPDAETEKESETWMYRNESIPYVRTFAILVCSPFIDRTIYSEKKIFTNQTYIMQENHRNTYACVGHMYKLMLELALYHSDNHSG